MNLLIFGALMLVASVVFLLMWFGGDSYPKQRRRRTAKSVSQNSQPRNAAGF